MDEVNVQYQNVDSGSQGLTTSDGKSISLSMNIGYEIADAAKLYSSYQHWDTTLVNKARAFLALEVPLKTWQEIYQSPDVLAQAVLESLQEDLGEEEGCVLILDVTLDQAVQARSYRFFTGGSALF